MCIKKLILNIAILILLSSIVFGACNNIITIDTIISENETCVGGTAFHINANDVNVSCINSSILIKSTTGTAFNITYNNTIVQNCTILAQIPFAIGHAGIVLGSVENVSILRNSMIGATTFVNSRNVYNVNIIDNNITLAGVADGIVFIVGKGGEISNNRFKSVAHVTGIVINIVLTNFINIKNNVIDGGGSIAIQYSGSSHAIIDNNTINQNGGVSVRPFNLGAFISNPNNITITNTIATSTTANVLFCNKCDDLVLINDTFLTTLVDHAVELLNSDNVYIDNSTISFSGGGFINGLHVATDSDNIFISNSLLDGSLAGYATDGTTDVATMINTTTIGAFRGTFFNGNHGYFKNNEHLSFILEGILLNGADNVTFINELADTTIGDAWGITNSRDIYINSSTGDATLGSADAGLRIQTTTDRVVIHDSNFTGFRYGGNFSDCDDCNATNTIFSGGVKDIVTIGGTANLRLYNSTFERGSVDRQSGGDVIWIYRPVRSNVTRSGIGVEGINVTLVNQIEDPADSQLTDSNGLTDWSNEIELTYSVSGDPTWYSLYNATITNINYTDNTKLEIMNITVSVADFLNRVNDTFQLPIIWNECVNENILTSMNITCNINCSGNVDAFNNEIIFISKGLGYTEFTGKLVNYTSVSIKKNNAIDFCSVDIDG